MLSNANATHLLPLDVDCSVAGAESKVCLSNIKAESDKANFILAYLGKIYYNKGETNHCIKKREDLQ